ncbi:MAG TPA: Gfo/Idh/MocA family oxidoreductase [Edaphobacter sp.]|nr:Gfo/Idh/MocA family oxidoreductase [Edaphobacter sp.]
MKIRVALIGCGTVGSIHAARLAGQRGVKLTAVYSPVPEAAREFAGRYEVRSVASSVEEAASMADAAIVCSPSPLHFEQAQTCMRAGRHVLVELPPCGDVREAEEIGRIARQQHVIAGCAHTARYLEPYVRIHAALRSGLLGEIQEISYFRYPHLPPRLWADNALVHHAAHILDLAMRWCGGLEPRACFAFPDASSSQSVSLLAKLPSGRSLTLAVSYGAKLPVSKMVVVGAKHTVETDGFSYVKSDLEKMRFVGDERDIYEQAILAQDMNFFEACQSKSSYIPWAETEDLMRIIQRFQTLATVESNISRLD